MFRNFWEKALAIVAFAGLVLAWVFSALAGARKRQAAEVATRFEQATAGRESYQRIGAARRKTQERHREEQQVNDARLEAGRRDQFDSDW